MPHRSLIRRLKSTSIATQVVFFLTVSTVPLGLIAIIQADKALRETRNLADAALVGQATRAALGERELISDALSAAEVLGQQILQTEGRDDRDCNAELATFIRYSERYVFAGFFNVDGQMTCSSHDARVDVADSERFRDMLANPRELVRTADEGPFSKIPVVIMTMPITDDGLLRGFVSISVPQFVMNLQSASGSQARKYNIALLDEDGSVITTNTGGGEDERWLPAAVDLAQIEAQGETVFRAPSEDGRDRTYVMAPVYNREVFVLASHVAADPGRLAQRQYAVTFLFPLAMWLTGLVVAYVALDRLILRHIAKLTSNIRAYETGDRKIEDIALRHAHGELEVLGQSFADMLQRIAHDEVLQAQALQEKNVLLREVYHRVKNNLQLILSIISMQLRNARTAEAREELTQLRQRVMGLATVHQRLYTAQEVHAVPGDLLFREVVEKVVGTFATPNAPQQVDIRADAVQLAPDQAVPMSLFVSEAVTNALARPGQEGPDGRIEVALKARDDRLEVTVRTRVPAGAVPPPADEPNLGMRLMDAFSQQLDGELQQETDAEGTLVRLTFPRHSSDMGAGTA